MNDRKTILELTSAKDAAYLKKAGWTIVDNVMWRDPRYKGRVGFGDYCDPRIAVRKQRDYDRWDKGLPVYGVCAARDRYGYLLRKCVGLDQPYVTVYRHHDKERLERVAANLNKIQGTVDDTSYAPDNHVYPYLLLCEEKHDTFRFHVPTREAFHKACLSVVKRRNSDGYWYVYEDAKELTPPTLSREQIAKLAEGSVKEAALEEWERHEAALKRVESEKVERALLAKALKGDGEAAADFLRVRKDGEYEGFEVVELDTIED